jgi:hypothetical protein
MGCRKNTDGNLSAKLFEAKLRQACQQADRLLEQKRAKMGRVGEAMTTPEVAGFMTEAEANQIVQPLIDPSVQFLQSYYEINIYEYLPAGSPKIAQIGAFAMRLKQLEDQGKSIDTSSYNYWFVPPVEMVSQANGEILTNAQNPSVFDCAMDALGIPAGLLIGSAKDLSKAALIKAARKLATRFIGWIGVGIAIYEFGDCMNWW